jgi:uncharacterized membrane protein YeaQ/YmgE (transglycosylase-associated protein family)
LELLVHLWAVFFGTQLGIGSFTGWNWKSFFLAVGGAIIILAVYRFIRKN